MRLPSHTRRIDAHSYCVHAGRFVQIALFRIRPVDPDWSALNQVREGPSIAFPVRPVRIHQVGLDPFVADSNTAILFDTTRPYRRSLVDEDGAEAISFRFSPEIAREAVRRFDPSVADGEIVFDCTHGPVASATYLHQRELFAHSLRHGEADPLFVEENALAILEDIVRAAFTIRGARAGPRTPGTERAHRELAETIKELLATCYSERLSLHDVSDALGGSSPFHLCRVFRRHTGKPVHQYLTDLRLRAAVERLDDREPIGRVAKQVGFGTHSHFTAVFRRELGVTPTELRQTLRWGELRRGSVDR